MLLLFFVKILGFYDSFGVSIVKSFNLSHNAKKTFEEVLKMKLGTHVARDKKMHMYSKAHNILL